ncbi:MAG: hypothetical protein A3J83_04810 [Elusimicrobia bacterium RIFOXYA2_FULL_40_6]|nr:MAG: hypothetical protein A3J83_04810 [Elusimicrobia bacterium RIFOXYA2_FULL_40_6]
MRKKNLIIYFGIVLMLVSAGCSRKAGTIKIYGSETMVKMAQLSAKEFMYVYPNTKIEIQTCTDDQAISALINSECAIAMTTRGIKKEEFDSAKNNNKELLQFIVGLQYTGIDTPQPSRNLLLFYANSKPKGMVKKYINFVLGTHGQKIVMDSGFVPIKK